MGDKSVSKSSSPAGKGKGTGKGKSVEKREKDGKKKTIAKKSSRAGAKGGKKKQVKRVGLLGMASYDPLDGDYDDSSDEDFELKDDRDDDDEPLSKKMKKSSKKQETGKSKKEKGGAGVRKNSRKRTSYINLDSSDDDAPLLKKKSSGKNEGKCSIVSFPDEILLKHVFQSLDQASKCRLTGTCKSLRRLMSTQGVWLELDISMSVTGIRQTKTGRSSQLSPVPLFLLCRDILRQRRFRHIESISMMHINLGAMGSAPELLIILFDNCPGLKSLNIWNSYCTQPEQGILNRFFVEKTIVEKCPLLEHLAYCPTENSSVKLIAKGSRNLKSLHISTDSSSRIGATVTDAALRDLSREASPTLQALTLKRQSALTKEGLGACLRDCAHITALRIDECPKINRQALVSLAPSLSTLTSLLLRKVSVDGPALLAIAQNCTLLEEARLLGCTGLSPALLLSDLLSSPLRPPSLSRVVFRPERESGVEVLRGWTDSVTPSTCVLEVRGGEDEESELLLPFFHHKSAAR